MGPAFRIVPASVGLTMVKNGQAFTYRCYTYRCDLDQCNSQEYLGAVDHAIRRHHGVWQAPGSITRP